MKKQAFLVIAVAFGMSGISSAVRPGQVVISDERVNAEVIRMLEEKEQSRNEERDSNIDARISEIPDAILVSPTNTDVRKQQIIDEENKAAHDDLENFKQEDLASRARLTLQDSDASRYNSTLNKQSAAILAVPAGGYLAYTGAKDLTLEGEALAKAVNKDLQVRHLTRELERARSAFYANNGEAGTKAAAAERKLKRFIENPSAFINKKYDEAVAAAEAEFGAAKHPSVALHAKVQKAKAARQAALLAKKAELYAEVLNLRSKLGLGVTELGTARTLKKDIMKAQKARIKALEASLEKAGARAAQQFKPKAYGKIIVGGTLMVGGAALAVKWSSDLGDFQIDRSLSRQNHNTQAPADSNISVESLDEL